jgi:hypothetical protein
MPKGYIDISIYDGQNDDTYKHTVYFNGAYFLQDLRQRIGDQAFFAFLQDYYMQSRGKIVKATDSFTSWMNIPMWTIPVLCVGILRIGDFPKG